MKILLIGHTGTIGAAVAKALAPRHEIIGAGRSSGGVRLDIDDPASVRAAFAGLSGIDAVVCAAGNARFKPLTELGDDDFAYSLRSKLMGQVNVIRAALERVADGGSITVTSGVLAQAPIPGSAAVSLVNSGLEGFVRGAALEAPRGIRVNVVSPGWARETLIAFGMDPAIGKPAADLAAAYVTAVEGNHRGATLTT